MYSERTTGTYLSQYLCHTRDHSELRAFQIKSGKTIKQPIPSDHAKHLCFYHEASESTIAAAIDGALAAKSEWESLPWNDRAAIFLKAADLVSGKYRYQLLAATMLGQGKNVWQAEIDAAAEVCFSRNRCTLERRW